MERPHHASAKRMNATVKMRRDCWQSVTGINKTDELSHALLQFRVQSLLEPGYRFTTVFAVFAVFSGL